MGAQGFGGAKSQRREVAKMAKALCLATLVSGASAQCVTIPGNSGLSGTHNPSEFCTGWATVSSGATTAIHSSDASCCVVTMGTVSTSIKLDFASGTCTAVLHATGDCTGASQALPGAPSGLTCGSCAVANGAAAFSPVKVLAGSVALA